MTIVPKIVLAPDSFKGSMTASQACQALESGARRVLPQAHFVARPLADGGEGTLDVLLGGATALNGANGASFRKSARVRGPVGAPVEAQWGILPDGRAVIEMARASGLTLVAPAQLDALIASSYGTGQLIRAALDAGCREILVGIGGSATTDGGVGALSALGLVARDARQRVLGPGGGALERLETLDLRFLDARLAKSHLTLLCDVSNPLLGSEGAARVYAPQKGASAAQIETLERGLARLASVVAQTKGRDLSMVAGAGAAGGLAFGLMSFCRATMRPGVEVALETGDFAGQLQGANLVLTGEGSLDWQTLRGKTVAGVCRIAGQRRVPVIGFGGAVRLDGAQMDELGLRSAFSLCDGPRSLQHCMEHGEEMLTNAVERAMRLIAPLQWCDAAVRSAADG